MRLRALASPNDLARGLARTVRLLSVAALVVGFSNSTASSQEPKPAASVPASQPSRAFRALAELDAWVQKKGGVVGIEVRDLDTGERLAEVGASRPLNPASAQKILTAAVVLDVLGGDYEFQTGLFGELEDGHVQDLVLRGHGDPSLGYADLARLARAVREMGLTQVRGNLLVDQSHFDEKFVPPAFEQQPGEWAAFRAPVSAISVDQNAVTLNVLATRAGKPARVWLTPPGVVKSSGEVTTRAAGTGQSVQWGLSEPGGRLESKLGGHVPEGQPRLRYVRRMEDPRLNPGRALAHALKREGVKLAGGVKLGGAGEETRLTYVASAPLSTLLYRVGKYSDNFYAETLFKGLSLDESDPPASSAGGARRMQRWLDEHKISKKSLRIKNGSGLFDANRLTAETLVSVLARVHEDPALRSEFLAQLAVGGVDGTLSARFRDPRVRARVRAKTGTLNNVDVLVGYVLRASGRAPIAFAILVNGIKNQHVAVRARIDRAVATLVED